MALNMSDITWHPALSAYCGVRGGSGQEIPPPSSWTDLALVLLLDHAVWGVLFVGAGVLRALLCGVGKGSCTEMLRGRGGLAA